MSRVCPEGSYWLKLNQDDDKICAQPHNLRGFFYNAVTSEMDEMTLSVFVQVPPNGAFTESPALLPFVLLILTLLYLVRG